MTLCKNCYLQGNCFAPEDVVQYFVGCIPTGAETDDGQPVIAFIIEYEIEGE